MATNPTLLTMPIAENGTKNTIPTTTTTLGRMSQDQGFPAETSLPLAAGGVAPSRADFNGAFNLLSDINFYAQKGWQFLFDASQDYYAGCIVRDATDGQLYECISDVSAGGSVPSADTTHWRVSEKVFYFDSVADMRDASAVVPGMMVMTKGYFAPNDGGAATYNIRAAEPGDVDDGGSIIILDNGNVAELIMQNKTYHTKQWGVIADGTTICNDRLNAVINAAITEQNATLIMDKGAYAISIYLSALRSDDATSPKNGNGLVIDGCGSVLVGKDATAGPFDVLQLNNVQNLRVQNLEIYSTVPVASDTDGINGISITGNSKNIYIENVYAHDCPGVEKSTYIDGGKAFTIQTSSTTIENVTFDRCRCANVYSAFWLDGAMDNYASKITVKDCVFSSSYSGVVVSYAYDQSLPESNGAEVLFTGNTILGAYSSVGFSRAQNVVFVDNVIESWHPSTSISFASTSTCIKMSACKNCIVKNNVFFAAVDSFASFATLNGTPNTYIIIADNVFKGTSTYFLNANSGTVTNSAIMFNKNGGSGTSEVTLKKPTFKNVVIEDTLAKFADFGADKVSFSNSSYNGLGHHLEVINSETLIAYQTISSSANFHVFAVCDKDKNPKFRVRNDGGLMIATTASALPAGATQDKYIKIYDASDNVIGYIPVYSTT